MCAGQLVVAKLSHDTSTPPHTHARYLSVHPWILAACSGYASIACMCTPGISMHPLCHHTNKMQSLAQPMPAAPPADCWHSPRKSHPHTRRNAAGSAQLRLVGSARHVHDCRVPAPWPLTFATVARTGLRWSWKLGLKPSVYLWRTKYKGGRDSDGKANHTGKQIIVVSLFCKPVH
jgi:hypothetical protein